MALLTINGSYRFSHDLLTVTDELGRKLEAPERNELLESIGCAKKITAEMREEALRVLEARAAALLASEDAEESIAHEAEDLG